MHLGRQKGITMEKNDTGKLALWLSRVPPIFWVLVVLIIGLSVVAREFATVSNAFNLIVQSATLTIMALGMMVVIASGGIDLSIGSIMTLSGTVVAFTIQTWNLNWLIATVLGIVACALWGMITGTVIAKGRIFPFIVTLGMLYMSRSVVLGILDGGTIPIYNESFELIANGFTFGLPNPVYVTLAALLLVTLLMRRTVFGRYVYAIGSSDTGARWLGINVDLYKVLIYALSAMLAGLAGIVLASRMITANWIAGEGAEFDAIAAVVIGGTSLAGGSGTIMGTVFGALIITVLRNGLVLLGLGNEAITAVTGIAVMIGVVLAQWMLRGGSHGK